MQGERRLHPRAVVGLPAEIRAGGQTEWDRARLYDLSAGGAAIHTPLPQPLQSEVRLRFVLPLASSNEAREINVLCLVVRQGGRVIGEPERPFFSGLHFLDLQGEDFDAVRRFVWDLTQSESV